MDNTVMEIDLKDLVHEVLKKWKVILIWTVVLGVVGGGIGFVRSGSSTESADLSEIEEVSEETELDVSAAHELELAREELTDREVQEVSRAIETYNEFESYYEEMNVYMENSLLMKIDPQNVSISTALYRIETSNDQNQAAIAGYPEVTSIANLYSKFLLTDTYFDRMRQALGTDTEDVYFEELISIAQYSETDEMYIQVYADDQETSETILDVLIEGADEVREEVQRAAGSFTAEMINRSFKVERNDTVYDAQYGHLSNQNTIRTNMQTAGNNLTTNGKTYYNLLLNALKDTGTKTETNSTEAAEETAKTVETGSSGHHFKPLYAAVGVILGLFLSLFYYVMKYLLSSKIRTSADVEKTCHLHVLGTIDAAADENDIRMLAAGIAVLAKQKQLDTILISGSAEASVRDALTEKLQGAEKLQGLHITSAADPVTNADVLEGMSGKEGIVFTEVLRTSKFTSIEKEMELAAYYGLQCLGCVVVR